MSFSERFWTTSGQQVLTWPRNEEAIAMFAKLMGLDTISPKELLQVIRDKQAVIFDVNSRQSWQQAHVPGALNIDPIEFQETDLPADKNSSLVFYCSNLFCRKAPNAARRAKSIGYSNVKVMSAGISGWLSSDLPTESAT
jgi:rhodanese-related sulfurtransferase